MSRNGGIATTFRAAFTQRTAPNTGVTLKMLANKTGYSEDTLARYRDDTSTITAEAVRRIDAALAGFGFTGFTTELYGCPRGGTRPALPPVPPGIAAPADVCLWFTHEGTLHDAAMGHAEFARRYLDLPASTEADPRKFAIEHMGWLAVTRRSDGAVLLDGRPDRAAQEAIERAAEWLEAQQQAIVRAPMLAIQQASAAVLAQKLRGLAAPRESLATWQPEQLTESQICDDDARLLWRAVHEAGIERANLVETADRLGVLDRCALFLIDGDSVTSAHLGGALAVDRSVVGRNVMSRRDIGYAGMLRQHALQTKAGPTVHRIDRRQGGGYSRIAFGQQTSRNTWQCMTMSYGIDRPAGFQPIR
jgi:hypothetical protein